MTLTENYCNSIWPLIYDQYNQGRHHQELAFYTSELASHSGPILEVACGTGMILLPLLESGFDIYGFDISQQMLEQLIIKAQKKNIPDLQSRITQQNMVDFTYDRKFEAVFIPARSFLHLETQQDQITCLQNIHRHLQDDGLLMMNFFTPDLNYLDQYKESKTQYRSIGQFQHPEDLSVIDGSTRQTCDLAEQVHHITWRFKLQEFEYESPMLVRWIYKQEFQLLVKLTGFNVRNLYSGFNKEPYNGEGEMVWILEKIS